jgi:molybdate transport system regulatory protein
MSSEDRNVLGFGGVTVTLLEGIEKYGSINQATKVLGIAYSNAWKIINKTEDELGVTLITRKGCLGSQLTDEAKVLIANYKEMVASAQKAVAMVFDKHYM